MITEISTKVNIMNNEIIFEAAEILSGLLDEANFGLPRNDGELTAYFKSDEVKRGMIQILIRSWKEAGSSHGPSVKVGVISERPKSTSIAIKSGTVPDKEAENKKKMKKLSEEIALGEQFVRCEQALLIALWNCNNDNEAMNALKDIAKDRLQHVKYYKMKLKSVKTGEEFQKDAEEITKLVKKKIGRDPKFKFTLDMRA